MLVAGVIPHRSVTSPIHQYYSPGNDTNV